MTWVTRMTKKGLDHIIFLVKNLKYFYLFIYGKISQQKLFDDVLESKNAF